MSSAKSVHLLPLKHTTAEQAKYKQMTSQEKKYVKDLNYWFPYVTEMAKIHCNNNFRNMYSF